MDYTASNLADQNMLLLTNQGYRTGNYSDLGKKSEKIFKKSKKYFQKICQARKKSRCFFTKSGHELVLFDLKRLNLIDNLLLGKSRKILDFCYFQNFLRIYLLVETKLAGASVKNRLRSGQKTGSRAI
jgi:hypothetical protein